MDKTAGPDLKLQVHGCSFCASEDKTRFADLIIFVDYFPWTCAEQNDTNLEELDQCLSNIEPSKVRKVNFLHFAISVKTCFVSALWLRHVNNI